MTLGTTAGAEGSCGGLDSLVECDDPSGDRRNAGESGRRGRHSGRTKPVLDEWMERDRSYEMDQQTYREATARTWNDEPPAE